MTLPRIMDGDGYFTIFDGCGNSTGYGNGYSAGGGGYGTCAGAGHCGNRDGDGHSDGFWPSHFLVAAVDEESCMMVAAVEVAG